MGKKRKQKLLETSLSDSSSNEEDNDDNGYLAHDGSFQKRRVKHSKQDHLYGVFIEEEDTAVVGKSAKTRLADKGVAFVAASDKSGVLPERIPESTIEKDSDLDVEMDIKMREDGGNDDGEDDNESGSESTDDGFSARNSSRIPRDDDEDEEEDPGLFRGGLGFASNVTADIEDVAKPGGLGFKSETTVIPILSTSKSQIKTDPSSSLSHLASLQFSSNKSRNEQSPKPTTTHPPPTSSAPYVPKHQLKSLQKSYGIGAKLLLKMGYQPGKGLGRDQSGIAKPIDVKLRPKGAGLAYGGFDERTDTVKEEQRRMGSVDSDQEDDKVGQSSAKKEKNAKGESKKEGWKAGKKRKKVQYKTADEIIQQSVVDTSTAPAGVQIVDMTGAQERVVSSTDLRTQSYYDDIRHIPELRHNLSLLTEISKSDLVRLTRQKTNDEGRLVNLEKEFKDLETTVTTIASKVTTCESVLALAQECSQVTVSADDGIDVFHFLLDKCLHELPLFRMFGLQELVVACIAPIIKRQASSWLPLIEPGFIFEDVKMYAKLFIFNREEPLKTRENGRPQTQHMTAWESLLWNVWLPKVRQAINNDWNVEDPDPVLSLLEKWCPTTTSTISQLNALSLAPGSLDSTTISGEKDRAKSAMALMPFWLWSNILDQLIMPKLNRHIENWNPRKTSGKWVLPWVSVLGSEDHRWIQLLQNVKQRIGMSFGDWKCNDAWALDVVQEWVEVLSSVDMDTIYSSRILPALILYLRKNFIVDPASQDLFPLQTVLAWSDIIPTHYFVHLLETEFFPKWYTVLYQWVTSESADFGEVGQWYASWKNVFPSHLTEDASMGRLFRLGLHMVEQALDDAEVVMPTFTVDGTNVPLVGGKSGAKDRAATGITFRDHVESVFAEENITFLPTGKSTADGKALFKASGTIAKASRNGILCYISEGVLFAQEVSEFVPRDVYNVVDAIHRRPK